MQLRPGMVLAYDRVEWIRRVKPLRNRSNTANFFDRKTYSGELSPHAKKRLKRAITLITATALPKKAMNFRTNTEFTFKLNFITLTLPGPQGAITDKQLKKEVLDVWLKAAKRRFKLKSYVWRAERQKNGNLHFHLVTDTYIPYDELRDTWNLRVERLGFITRFEKKHNHRHPNSTDVHAIHNVKNLAGYFMKYMAKDAKDSDVIQGKVWDCSINLKQKQNCEMLLEDEELELLAKIGQDESINRKHTEHCTMWFLTYAQFKRLACQKHLQLYNNWLKSIRDFQKRDRTKNMKEISPEQLAPF